LKCWVPPVLFAAEKSPKCHRKAKRKKQFPFVKDTNFFLSSEESAAAVCLLATVLMVLYQSVAFKVKSVCGCWPMWLHYKIENKKTGPRILLWWSSDSFAGEFSPNPDRKNMISTNRKDLHCRIHIVLLIDGVCTLANFVIIDPTQVDLISWAIFFMGL
jgi:hypothetical protein